MFTQDFEDAIFGCYEAVAASDNWNGALDRLARAVGASAVMFYPKDVGDGASAVPCSTAYADLLEEYVAGGWYDNHYRALRGWPLFEQAGQRVVLEHDLATDEERRKLPHYNELYLKWGFPAFAAIGFRVAGKSWCLPLMRTEKDGGFFTREEANDLKVLAPHLERIVRLSSHLENCRNNSSLASFDKSGTAAVLLDSSGRICGTNSTAENFFALNSESLICRSGRLRARRLVDDLRLQAFIRCITDWRISPAEVEISDTLYLPRFGQRPIALEAISPPGVVRTFASVGHAIVLIRDLDQSHVPDAQKFVHALNITPAEARLCEQLLRGQTVKQASEVLHVTEGTARQQLKSVLQKTGIHRQSELLLLLARL